MNESIAEINPNAQDNRINQEQPATPQRTLSRRSFLIGSGAAIASLALTNQFASAQNPAETIPPRTPEIDSNSEAIQNIENIRAGFEKRVNETFLSFSSYIGSSESAKPFDLSQSHIAIGRSYQSFIEYLISGGIENDCLNPESLDSYTTEQNTEEPKLPDEVNRFVVTDNTDETYNRDSNLEIIFGLSNVLFEKQPARARHLVLSGPNSNITSITAAQAITPNGNVADEFKAVTFFNTFEEPSLENYKDFLYSLVQQGLPLTKEVYPNKNQDQKANGDKFYIAGTSLPESIAFNDYALQTWNANKDFLKQRFFDEENATPNIDRLALLDTQKLIKKLGPEGLITASNAWASSLIVDALTNDPTDFERWPSDIQALVLKGLNFVVNGNNETETFAKTDLHNLRNKLENIKDIALSYEKSPVIDQEKPNKVYLPLVRK
jgi:hypothetical protein